MYEEAHELNDEGDIDFLNIDFNPSQKKFIEYIENEEKFAKLTKKQRKILKKCVEIMNLHFKEYDTENNQEINEHKSYK